jgi:NAD(P)-dependent dehydrogenase (short-subunit alcohol dehydrogenase family)
MPNRLTGRIALVTGGSRGVGAGIALRLAREGACVGVHYQRDAKAASAVVEHTPTVAAHRPRFRHRWAISTPWTRCATPYPSD